MLIPLNQLTRRKKQLETLRQMIDRVDEELTYIAALRDERELTADEEADAQARTIRRERIAKSIDETESTMDSARR